MDRPDDNQMETSCYPPERTWWPRLKLAGVIALAVYVLSMACVGTYVTIRAVANWFGG